jgi:hypothetical protein
MREEKPTKDGGAFGCLWCILSYPLNWLFLHYFVPWYVSQGMGCGMGMHTAAQPDTNAIAFLFSPVSLPVELLLVGLDLLLTGAKAIAP